MPAVVIRMHADTLLADTGSIRAFGRAADVQAAELLAAAATLAAAPAPTGLGPVAASFLAALAEAMSAGSREIAALGERVSAGAAAADVSAMNYDAGAQRGADRLVRAV
ncbi:hypothetical protein [Mycobacterium sp. NPDC050041]|uniref:hypothetical protein n=1 Tax=Mycobacterium sp. NPDC050041 TaxID=3364293 RepID=UPI003C2CFE8A